MSGVGTVGPLLFFQLSLRSSSANVLNSLDSACFLEFFVSMGWPTNMVNLLVGARFVEISALVTVHNIEYMTSCSIYMWDIKASGPACHPPNHSEVLQSRLTGHPGVAVMTRDISKPTPLPAVVRWPPSWTGRSNHHFTGTLVQALSSLS